MLTGKQAEIERVRFDPQPERIDDAMRLIPGGGYTTFRTFGKYGVLHLADHFRRLSETAQLEGKPVKIQREAVIDGLHMALDAYPADEARVRIVIDFERQPGDLYLVLEPLRTPAEMDYAQGVQAVTRRMQRNNPKAKLTGFLNAASAVRQDLPPNINEAIMIGKDRRLLEGLSSNFFAIKDGVVWTAEEGVLSGITRSLVLGVIEKMGVTIRYEGFPVESIEDMDEAFITSASRGVLPVVGVDGKPIKSGVPGEMTTKIRTGYLTRIEKEIDIV